MRHGLRYKPNSDWNERKEREGFVCSSNTARIPIDVEYCVAVKRDEFGVSIRNTKDPYDTTLTFNRDEWLAFITGVKNGEFELL